jgi:hypothetical protein
VLNTCAEQPTSTSPSTWCVMNVLHHVLDPIATVANLARLSRERV